MIIEAIKDGTYLRMITSSGPIPEGTRLNLYTAAELNTLAKGPTAWKATQLESAFHED